MVEADFDSTLYFAGYEWSIECSSYLFERLGLIVQRVELTCYGVAVSSEYLYLDLYIIICD